MPSLQEWTECKGLPLRLCNGYREKLGMPPLPDDWSTDQPSRGLGDMIAKAIHRVSGGRIKPCGGCKKRQAVLNRVVPFRQKQAKSAQPPEQPRLPDVPFDGPITRDLVYHCWPVRGKGTWQANLDQLLARIDLFNGRRLMGIVTSKDADPPEAVREYVAGHGFEFIVAANEKQRRECVTFLPMLDRIQNTDPNRVFFFAHAKGVRHAAHDNQGTTVHRWARAMYETCLDDWDAAQAALESHAFAGAFRRFGQFTTPGNHRWHYSGSFYWGRSMWLFRDNWRNVDNKFFGVESWPGRMVSANNAACLFMDNSADLYQMDYWINHVEPELEKWKSNRSVIV
jgi:hypothetical protein